MSVTYRSVRWGRLPASFVERIRREGRERFERHRRLGRCDTYADGPPRADMHILGVAGELALHWHSGLPIHENHRPDRNPDVGGWEVKARPSRWMDLQVPEKQGKHYFLEDRPLVLVWVAPPEYGVVGWVRSSTFIGDPRYYYRGPYSPCWRLPWRELEPWPESPEPGSDFTGVA